MRTTVIDRALWFIVLIWALFVGVIYPHLRGWNTFGQVIAFLTSLSFLMFYYHFDKKLKEKRKVK